MQKSTEHSETIKEQSNSVVSIEDAADAYAKGIANSDKTERRLAKCDFSHGANWQKEQYNSLLNSYRELLDALENMCVWHETQSTWDKGNNGYYHGKRALTKGAIILSQFKR